MKRTLTVLMIAVPLGVMAFPKLTPAAPPPPNRVQAPQRIDRNTSIDRREEARRAELQREAARREELRREEARRTNDRRVWIPGHWEPGFLGIGRKWVEGRWETR